METKEKTTFEKLHEIALNAPKTSGTYIWKNSDGVVIYVGKAKSLKMRLTSYFREKKDVKTRLLVSHATMLEYIQTKNEYEALLLENTLIKKHSPKYNISLKDGKTYPMLKVTNEAFPRLYRTRTIHNDGARYFGPFANVQNVDTFLNLIKQNYKLHQCKRLQKKDSPCLYYHIGRCNAPCCGKISEDEYNKSIKEIVSILTGDTKKIIKKLEKEMKSAVEIQDFESATILRDNIEAINALQDKNVVQDLDATSRDYISFATAGQMITFAVLKMRGGRLVTRDLYRSQTLKDNDEAVLEFFMSYYCEVKNIPASIFVLSSHDCALLQQWFKKELKTDVKIYTSSIIIEDIVYSNLGKEREVSPQSARNIGSQNSRSKKDAYKDKNTLLAGENIAQYSCNINAPTNDKPDSLIEKHFNKKMSRHHYAALEMARFNAKEDITARLRQTGDFPALEELKEIAGCKELPTVIEGFDIAHLQGNFTVAGMASFYDGKPNKKGYCLFRLRTTEGIIDDYKSMKEAVSRRYTRLINEGRDLPDLILIDGGAGQVNAAWKVLQLLNLNIPLIGLAEKNEELYFPNNSTPLVLPRRSYALRLLQRVRDEVHRFSNSYVAKMNVKAKTTSVFEKLPHVGKKRASILMKKFFTFEELGKATTDEIRKAIHVSEREADEIKMFIDDELARQGKIKENTD